MTTSAILKAIHALPMEEQMKIIEQVIRSLRLGSATISKRKPSPDNPSPSGDPWFDDPQNIAIVESAIKHGSTEKDIVLKSKEDIKQYFVNQ
jgi:hypothetical protein